tara:strand:+ start:337 stop:771 length:435 start_codon:yes stop_codon:yes gene_type:complete
MPQYGTLKIDEILYNDSGTDVTVDLLNLQFFDTGALKLNAGTTAQRPGTPTAGMFRYNTQTSQFEGYTNAWGQIGGSGGGGGSSTLAGLSDVTISSASSGQVLKYNGTAWVNSASLIQIDGGNFDNGSSTISTANVFDGGDFGS